MHSPSQKPGLYVDELPLPRSSRETYLLGQLPQRTVWIWATVFFLSLVLVAPSVAPAAKKKLDAEEIFNPLLGVDYSHWLVGPIYQMASTKEVEQYLSLSTDEEAVAFIGEFWQKRNQGTGFFEESPQQLFDKRAVEADKRYTEGAYPGRRSDRGTIFILFGEPEEITFETPRQVSGLTTEVWSYPKNGEPGLHEEKPKRQYRFVKEDGQTVFFKGQRGRRDLQRRQSRF